MRALSSLLIGLILPFVVTYSAQADATPWQVQCPPVMDTTNSPAIQVQGFTFDATGQRFTRIANSAPNGSPQPGSLVACYENLVGIVGPSPGWQIGTINRNADGYYWVNGAGIRWGLTLFGKILTTDSTNPYVDSGHQFILDAGSALDQNSSTLVKLKSQLESLNISATELKVRCATATATSNADSSNAAMLRQTLIVDQANPIPSDVGNVLQSLNDAVVKQVQDESLTLAACKADKLNQIAINEVEDRFSRVASLPSNASEQMIASASEGTLVTGGCDSTNTAVELGATIETLQSTGTWTLLPLQATPYLDPIACPDPTHPYARYVIADLAPGTSYKWYMPYWSPPVIDANPRYTTDYFSHYAQQIQQVSMDSQDTLTNYTNIWNSALGNDIQMSVNGISHLITSFDSQIRTQEAKFPKQRQAYQSIISAEPALPVLPKDSSSATSFAVAFLRSVTDYQAVLSAELAQLVPRPISIQCIKVTRTKTVTGLTPKCPTGYRLKK